MARKPRYDVDRPGRIGDYWVSKRPGSTAETDSYQRTWYDKGARGTRYQSLGTQDFREACDRLAVWYLENTRPEKASPGNVRVADVMSTYYSEHGTKLASARTEKLALGYWSQWWGAHTIAEITTATQANFVAWLKTRTLDRKAHKALGAAGIDRILDSGRAALNHARKHGVVTSIPHIFRLQKAAQKRARPPKGRPIGPEEIAKLLDAASSWHSFMFVLIMANTLCRPEAALEVGPAQYDAAHHLLDLNPATREQTNKFRPIVPVGATLRPFLTKDVGPSGRYVSYRDKPIESILAAFRVLRTNAALSDDVTPYSIRHGMARELRKRRVPTEQISIVLGHLPKGSAATTSIYAPFDPDYCLEAAAAIEDVMREVRGHLKRASLDLAPVAVAGVSTGRAVRRGIGEAKREQIRELILGGIIHREVVRISGVSGATVSQIRQELKQTHTLYRAIARPVSARFARGLVSSSDAPHTQVLEKVGRPGRTRTDDNTVMSGVTPAGKRQKA